MTFQRATHALKSHLASAPRALNANAPPTLAGSLAGQRVFFSNPRGISQSELKKSCAAVGLTFVKANINPRDLNSPDVWRNVAKEIGKLSWSVTKTVGVGGGSGVAAAVVSGSGLNEAVTKAAELWQAASALASGVDFDNAATAAIAAGAAGVAIVTSYSKVSTSFLAMRALATSTFGRGNEFWYEDDKSLLRQLRA